MNPLNTVIQRTGRDRGQYSDVDSRSFRPEDDQKAVDAYEAAEWLPLLKHNLADIQRTRELAHLADRYVPQSDFGMKNLQPPERS